MHLACGAPTTCGRAHYLLLVPRSVIVVSKDPDLFASLRASLLSDSRFLDADTGVHCDGSVAPLTNIYPVEMTPAEWNGWQPVDGEMPDPESMSTLVFECRSAAWVAEVGALLAEGLKSQVWFVDSTDTAWPADRVDPQQIVLA